MNGQAAPTVEVGEDVVTIRRRVRLTWPVGAGPEVATHKTVRGVRREITARLTQADIAFTYAPDAGTWRSVIDITARQAMGTGWSHYPTPILGSNCPTYGDLIRTLHTQYTPHARITITDTEPNP